MHDIGFLGLVHWDDTEGWYGEGGGKRLQDGEFVYTHGGFMLMYGKNHYNIVISLQLKFKKKQKQKKNTSLPAGPALAKKTFYNDSRIPGRTNDTH